MNGVPKTLAARGVALAALASLCLGIGSAHAAFPYFANNGKIAYVSGGFITTSGVACPSAQAGFHPAFSPNGSKIAYDDGTSLFVMNADCSGSSPVGVTGTEPSWSPDGATLAFVNAGNVFTVPVLGGATSQRTFAGTATDPSFSPSGSLIAYIAGTILDTVTASGGSSTVQILSGLVAAGSPSWSPSGSQIAFSAGAPSQINLVNSGGGGLVTLNDGGQVDTEPSWSPDGTLIAFATSPGGINTMTTSGASITTVISTAAATQPDWQGAAPVNVTPPTISPSTPPFQGGTITSSVGAWSGTPTSYAFQWLRCAAAGAAPCNPIVGATSSTYIVQAADVGPTVSLVSQVTASNIAGASNAVVSPPAGTAVGPAPTNVTKPVISGKPAAFPGGTSVSTSTGTWTGATPITYTFQWQYCDYLTPPQCGDIPLATSSFYSPTGDYIGKRLQVVVTATNASGSGTATSAFSYPVTGEQPRNTISPKIVGTIEVGSTLISDTGTWTGSVPLHYTYQWLRCAAHGLNCIDIAGATNTSYLLQPADYGSTIVFKVIVTNGAGAGVGQSIPTSPIRHRTLYAPSNANPPVIAGKAFVGSTLVGDPGSWTGEPVLRYTYTWLRCDATGGACIGIPNVAGKVYKVKPTDVGSTIKFLVTVRNTVGVGSADSDATDVVTRGAPCGKGRPLMGTKGNDYLVGGRRTSRIYGLGGNDVIISGACSGLLSGGPGNDVITNKGPGSDHIFGGPGSDTIYAANGVRDWIDCGPGVDRAYVDAIDVVKNCETVTVVQTP